jgi:hypothetical protein
LYVSCWLSCGRVPGRGREAQEGGSGNKKRHVSDRCVAVAGKWPVSGQ